MGSVRGPVDQKAAATQVPRAGERDGQGEGRGDRGIDGVPPAAQYGEPDGCRFTLRGDHHAPGRDERPAGGRARGRCDREAREQSHDEAAGQ